jgi:hypothetical protein
VAGNRVRMMAFRSRFGTKWDIEQTFSGALGSATRIQSQRLLKMLEKR